VLGYHTSKSVVTVPCHGKDRVFVPALPRDLADLKARIIAAVKNIDAPMLTRVWRELESRFSVCRVILDARIERL
jgi:hypothetical protein